MLILLGDWLPQPVGQVTVGEMPTSRTAQVKGTWPKGKRRKSLTKAWPGWTADIPAPHGGARIFRPGRVVLATGEAAEATRPAWVTWAGGNVAPRQTQGGDMCTVDRDPWTDVQDGVGRMLALAMFLIVSLIATACWG